MFIGIGEKPLAVGEKAPDFTLPSASSRETVSLKDFYGKKVFLFFFRGTWCPNCANHMRAIQKELAELQKKGVVVLGICCQGAEAMSAFLKREKIDFPLLSDKNRETAKAYGVYVYLSWDSINIARPSFFFIDEKGIIRYQYVGDHQWDRPDMEVLKKLAEEIPAG
jgi:peroxiredoxin